jgi:exodeoxyribonuclease VII small subunit
MSDDRNTFESTRVRLDEILVQVRKKDTSLEQGLELLEEGVRLANLCNELIDQTSWRPDEAGAGDGDAEDSGVDDPESADSEQDVAEPLEETAEASSDDTVLIEDDERD